MLTILFESVQGKQLKNFRTLSWNSSNNLPDSATKTFWQVRTMQRKFGFIEYLKMKSFFHVLGEKELQCLYDAPGVLNDDLYAAAVIARKQVFDFGLLVSRLNILQRLINRREWSENLFFTIHGTTSFTLQECRQAIRPATKYSGYVRNSSAVGSKNSNKKFIPEPETVEWYNNEKLDFLGFLTVGEFASGTPGGSFFTLKRALSSKRYI